MKNLKKVLALVLVFASLLGLATMASATKSDDYSDAASITHYEAVDVMSTIGVFDGISGAFSGDSILTREQAAKIITYMVLGKDEADALVASVAPYTDVARDRWSAGSIAYCKNEGILAGVGNGRFEPTGKLTGVAFAKMCLVALGYDPDIQELTGASWAVNTSRLAIADAGITGNLSQASLADEMSREDACQMALNTLKADMVDYPDRGGSITVNDVTFSMTASKAKPVSKENGWKDTDRNDGKIDGVQGGDGIQQFAEKYFPNLTKSFSTDSFGRPSNIWTYKAEEIGTYNRNDWLRKSWTAKATKGEMYNAIGSSVYNWLTDDDDPTTLTSHVDGGYWTSPDAKVYFAKNSSEDAGQKVVGVNGMSGNGVLTELYVNDEGDVWVTMINTYLVQANADYNTTNKSVTVTPIDFDDSTDTDPVAVGNAFLPTEISSDDFDVTGVKEGDYLLVTVSGINDDFSDSDLESVTPATVQKGTVTEWTQDTNVVMGGTKYSYNKILKASQKGTEFAIDTEATLVLDTYGYIMHVDDSVDANSFVYIDKFGTNSLITKAMADAYFTDGTNAEISVSKVDSTTKAADIADKDEETWYTFTGSAGGQYTLKSLDTGDDGYEQKVAKTASHAGQKLIKSSTVKFMSGLDADLKDGGNDAGAKTVKANDKTIFVVKTSDSVNAYNGIDNVPNVTLGDYSGTGVKVSWAEKKNADPDKQYAKVVFIDVSDAGDEVTVDDGTSVADYMFVLDTNNKTTHVNGLTYKTYTVVIDGKVEDRWVEDSLNVGKGRLYYSVKEDSNGRIKSVKEVGKGNSQKRFMAAMGATESEAEGLYKTKFAGYAVGADTVIKRSGRTLTIPALAKASYKISDDVAVDPKDKSDLITTDKSNINLIIGKVSGQDNPLLKDKGASYEKYLNTSVSQVTGLLGNKGLSGRVYVVVTEDNGDVVESLWIYVTNAYDV